MYILSLQLRYIILKLVIIVLKVKEERMIIIIIITENHLVALEMRY